MTTKGKYQKPNNLQLWKCNHKWTIQGFCLLALGTFLLSGPKVSKFLSLSPRKNENFRDLHAQFLASCLWGGAFWRCLSLLKDQSGENWFILDALLTRQSQATRISFNHLVHTSSILHSLDSCNEECCEWGMILSAANDAVLLSGNIFPQFIWITMNFFL